MDFKRGFFQQFLGYLGDQDIFETRKCSIFHLRYLRDRKTWIFSGIFQGISRPENMIFYSILGYLGDQETWIFGRIFLGPMITKRGFFSRNFQGISETRRYAFFITQT